MRNTTTEVANDPLSYSWLTYAWVLALAAWGGIAGYIRRVKHRTNAHFSLAELVGEIVISGFVGILTFYLCQSANMTGPLSAAMVGAAGHMGSRALYFLEAILRDKLAQIFGKNLDNV